MSSQSPQLEQSISRNQSVEEFYKISNTSTPRSNGSGQLLTNLNDNGIENCNSNSLTHNSSTN